MSNIIEYTYRIVKRLDNRLAVYKCFVYPEGGTLIIGEDPIIDVITDVDDGKAHLIDHLENILEVLYDEDVVEEQKPLDASFTNWSVDLEEEYDEDDWEE